MPNNKWKTPMGTFNTGIQYIQEWQRINPSATKKDADKELLRLENTKRPLPESKPLQGSLKSEQQPLPKWSLENIREMQPLNAPLRIQDERHKLNLENGDVTRSPFLKKLIK